MMPEKGTPTTYRRMRALDRQMCEFHSYGRGIGREVDESGARVLALGESW